MCELKEVSSDSALSRGWDGGSRSVHSIYAADAAAVNSRHLACDPAQQAPRKSISLNVKEPPPAVDPIRFAIVAERDLSLYFAAKTLQAQPAGSP
jgi:hypothetical protein